MTGLREGTPLPEGQTGVGSSVAEGGAQWGPMPAGSFLLTMEDSSFRATQRIYAHRTLPHVLACSVSIARLAAGSRPITVPLRSAFSPESPDLALHLGPDFRGAR